MICVPWFMIIDRELYAAYWKNNLCCMLEKDIMHQCDAMNGTNKRIRAEAIFDWKNWINE